MVPNTDAGTEKTHRPKKEDAIDHTHVSWRPIGAVECSECNQTKRSGGRLKLCEAGEFKPHYDGLVCENCKDDLLHDE